jgi:lipoprotein-anchoring transpeptidase ErfK/SrfK
MPLRRSFILVFFVFIAASISAQLSQPRLPGPQTQPRSPAPPQSHPRSPAPQSPPQPQFRKAAELIQKQPPMKVNQSVLKQITQENSHIVVSIPKQRGYLMLGNQIAIDAPISSGRRGHSTPTGHFTVLEKDPNHHSTLYGDYVDRGGRVVRAGISARADSAPSGTHFEGASMKWFLRLTADGVGMHIGILPGYPASHGCVRQSVEGAKLFYDHAKVGTAVDVGDY